MKICALSDLSEKIIIENISAVKKTPAYRSSIISGRKVNGFLMIDSGVCIYKWEDNEVTLKKGSLIYLPSGSHHRLYAPTEDFSFYNVDFTMSDEFGNNIIFSHTPMLMCAKEDQLITEIIHRMTKVFLGKTYKFKLISSLYELFDRIITVNETNRKTRIQSAIDYVETNFTNEIDFDALSSICFLSKAQMYRLFKKETGYSPNEYKNHLRIERAKIMLHNDTSSVEEISELLGFENPCYFSRIFKKYMGAAPTEYRKTLS